MPFPRIVKEAQARRDEILDVAQALFAQKGYDAASISDIIGEVGVSKGAFYHHFASKEDLLEAIARRYAEQTAASTRALLDDPTLDSFAKLVAFLGTMRGQKLRTAVELRATFEPVFRAENMALFERTRTAVNSVVRPHFVRIIADGVAERTFDTPNPEEAADTIMHLMTSNRELICELYLTRDRLTFERLARRLTSKLVYLGTVIDRILGLPEGSIELADPTVFEILACGLDAPPDAA